MAHSSAWSGPRSNDDRMDIHTGSGRRCRPHELPGSRFESDYDVMHVKSDQLAPNKGVQAERARTRQPSLKPTAAMTYAPSGRPCPAFAPGRESAFAYTSRLDDLAARAIGVTIKEMNKEQVYDSQASPLMKKIIEICMEHGIAMMASFDIVHGGRSER